jgi:uncharacterized protein YbaR (Trm112 family)
MANSMKYSVMRVLACPICKGDVKHEDAYLYCQLCDRKYNIRNGIPIMMVDNGLSGEPADFTSSFSTGIYTRIKGIKYLGNLIDSIKPPSLSYSGRGKNSLEGFLRGKNGSSDTVILNIGSGGYRPYSQNEILLDIDVVPYVDIVGDGHRLPIKSESIDKVFMRAVMEHVAHPDVFASEVDRVLKKNGLLFNMIPFIFPLHAYPNDYFRYTPEGIKQLFPNYEIIESGNYMGPSVAFAYTLKYFLATLFSLNNKYLYNINLWLFGWMVKPIIYFDKLICDYKFAHLIASTYYFISKKIK